VRHEAKAPRFTEPQLPSNEKYWARSSSQRRIVLLRQALGSVLPLTAAL